MADQPASSRRRIPHADRTRCAAGTTRRSLAAAFLRGGVLEARSLDQLHAVAEALPLHLPPHGRRRVGVSTTSSVVVDLIGPSGDSEGWRTDLRFTLVYRLTSYHWNAPTFGLLSCPANCSVAAGDTFDDCRCSCPTLDKDAIMNLTFDEAYSVLAEHELFDLMLRDGHLEAESDDALLNATNSTTSTNSTPSMTTVPFVDMIKRARSRLPGSCSSAPCNPARPGDGPLRRAARLARRPHLLPDPQRLPREAVAARIALRAGLPRQVGQRLPGQMVYEKKNSTCWGTSGTTSCRSARSSTITRPTA